MKFKKIIPILLSFSYCFNSQCMEKHSSNSAKLSLGLYIPSSDYLVGRDNFYNYIVEKLYEHFLKYYKKYGNFTLELNNFLCSIYGKKDNVDRYDKKDNVDPYKLPLESLIRTLTNFYHCLDRDNVLIEKNEEDLLNSWDEFLEGEFEQVLQKKLTEMVNL